MILEIYTVVALLCDKHNNCAQRTVWTGRHRAYYEAAKLVADRIRALTKE